MGEKYAIVEFEDGLQVIPSKWFNADLSGAYWPTFTTLNNKRYDKAVKLMEDPKCTWVQHPIVKIYGTYNNYELARRKLKDAELLSDINSGSEVQENLKKSRKIRAAKTFNDSSNDELSDDLVLTDIPQFPTKRFKTAENRLTPFKNNKNLQIDHHFSEGVKQNKKIPEKQIHEPNILKNENVPHTSTTSDSYLNMPICSETETSNVLVINEEDLYLNEQNLDTCVASFVVNEQNTPNVLIQNSKSLLSQPSNVSVNNKETDNFQRFVIKKLVAIELKINAIERHQKLILEKLPFNNNEDKENIDVSHDFPLKNENDLQDMENKLQDNEVYRKQLIKQLSRVTCRDIKTSCIHLMRKVFSNYLAANYSWYGAKKKEKFSQLQICKVIMCAIRRLHDNATDEDISSPIKIWLAHAKERLEKERK
ncbi:hypothetical protein PUN28_018425 [Cardiocondyla obscurior]|uniref:DUF4806 domain-containing protein n=3 Tax=Cardiocondyla obscurior TaxID=286306 RepID=A0AAW2EI79_9HYME